MNVIIFIIRVLKLLLMNYRLALIVVLLLGVIVIPASASLIKVPANKPVYSGEVGLDISSGLAGSHQIAWWPAGIDTSTPPGKILDIQGDIHNYNISPADFSGYEGQWYTWDFKPSIPVFEVKKPELTLKIWDLDHDRDVTGQSIPQSTRITYRIDTNLDLVLNKLNRSDINPLDLFYDVGLKGPTGLDIYSIYTGSAGAKDTVVLPVESKPFITSSPYFWNNGGQWDRTARGGKGEILYPLGTYTFTASQNLNNMKDYYHDLVGVTISGPQSITFIADQSVPAPTATPYSTATLSTLVTTPQPTLPATTVTTLAPPRAVTTVTKKPTWTSAPLPEWVTFMALGMGCMVFALCRKHSR
jgi:hypothetical protein